MTSTVRHWKRSFKCDHTHDTIRNALTAALNCQGLSTSGVDLLTVLLEDRGEANYLVPGGSKHVFRTVKKRR